MYDAKTLTKELTSALTNLNDICNKAMKDGFIVKYGNAMNEKTGQMEIGTLEIYQRIINSYKEVH